MKPRLNNKSSICFIYGFADIHNDAEIIDWKNEIEELKINRTKAIIIIFRQSSKGYQEISKSADLCLILTEEKFKYESNQKQFVQLLNDYLVKPFSSDGIWEIKPMSKYNNSFDFVSETIGLDEFKNSSIDIVRRTIEKMILKIHKPKDLLFLIVFSDESYEKFAGQICEIVNEIDKKKNSYLAFGASKNNFLEISLLGTEFEI